MKLLPGLLVLFVFFFSGFGCRTVFPDNSFSGARPIFSTASYEGEIQRKAVEGGISLVGKKVLRVNGVTYPNDCTGVVRAAYAFANMDLAFRFSSYTGNGVKRLFLTLEDEGLLYSVDFPQPGDLIFWDNTYDANENGLADDELTHVGMVVSVDSQGSISYLHYNYSKGPVIERMNLLKPGDDEKDARGLLNSPLRMKTAPKVIGSGSASLYRIFGKAYELDAQYP